LNEKAVWIAEEHLPLAAVLVDSRACIAKFASYILSFEAVD